MELKLSENIRYYRKQKELTQEHLAEVLGVSVGAVYKWEAGLSTPELRLIVEMADYFEISVDVLLGYEQQNENVEKRIEAIRSCILKKDFKEAITEVERTLKKFPHNFEVVNLSAVVYTLKGVEDKDERILQRSNQLLHQALTLIPQDKYKSITEISIKNTIAENYMIHDKTKQALEVYEDNNVCGINNSYIGYIYAKDMGQAENAWEYLKAALVNDVGDILRTSLGMIYMYKKQEPQKALETIDWIIGFFNSLKIERSKLTFVDKHIAALIILKALCLTQIKKYDMAKEETKKSYELAKAFDENPIYSMDGMKFINQDQELVAYDDMGKTVMEAIENTVLNEWENEEAVAFVRETWEKLKDGDR